MGHDGGAEVISKSSVVASSWIASNNLVALTSQAVLCQAMAGARLDLMKPAEGLYDEAAQAGLGKLDSCGVLKILEP